MMDSVPFFSFTLTRLAVSFDDLGAQQLVQIELSGYSEGSHSSQELSAIHKCSSSDPLEHAGKLAPVRQGCQRECPVSPAANARL